jgi:4-amino-4-deoxy-L-arabinose transferase-like glycosyltransferase
VFRFQLFLNMEKIRPALKYFVIAICLVTFGLRFATLLADFPPNIDWSGDLYSDEGWYSAGAVNHVLTAAWVLPGDLNAVINIPVFHGIQAIAFSLFGLSLSTARTTVVVFMLLLTILAFVWVRNSWGDTAAWIAVLLLSTNFFLFAYSRIALLEIPMTTLVVAALVLADCSPSIKPWIAVLLALIYSLALLTKNTAIFGFPLLLLLMWLKPGSIRSKLLNSLTFIAAFTLFFGGYMLWASRVFPDDFRYFLLTDSLPRYSPTIAYFLKTILRVVWNARFIDPFLLSLALLSIPLGLLLSRRFRTHPFVLVSLTWLVVYGSMLVTRGYLPSRYYLPLSIPVILLAAAFAHRAFQSIRSPVWKYVPLALLAAICAWNLIKMAQYVAAPKYSYISMAHDVGRRVASANGKNKMLLGWITHTLSIETRYPALDSKYGTRDIEWKLATYRPGYYVGLETRGEDHAWLGKSVHLELLASYDVFNNYYAGKRVYLYRLDYR